MIRPSFFAVLLLFVTCPVRAESTAGGAVVTSSTSPSTDATPASEAVAPEPEKEPVANLSVSERAALARTEYHKGNAAFGEGRFTAARAHFQRALEAEESFDVLCNLGRTDAELRDDVSAAEHLRRGLRIYPTDPELASARQRFLVLLTEVEARLSDMQKEIVEMRVAHADAEAVAARASERDAVEPKPVQPAPTADAGAKPEPRSSARLPVSLVVGGTGLVLVGVGVGFLVDSSSAATSADALLGEMDLPSSACRGDAPSADCERLSSMNEQSDRSLVAGAVLAGVGGGLVLGGILTYLLWPDPSDSTTAFVRPSLQGNPATRDFAMGLRGRF